jgi:hypothetical protein
LGKSSSGIFQHEKVVRFYECVESHFNALLDTLKQQNVFNDGMEKMKQWDAKTVEQEMEKMKCDDEEWETFAHATMCEYLKETFKPPGQKIRVRPPKANEFIKKLAQYVALNKDINSGAYFTFNKLEKEQVFKKCFRKALRKLCDRTRVVQHMPSYASDKSGNVKPSIVSQLLSKQQSVKSSMKPPSSRGGSMLSRRSSLLTKPSITRQQSQAPTDDGDSRVSSQKRSQMRSQMRSQKRSQVRSQVRSHRSEKGSEKPSLRAGMIKSVTPEDSVSQVPSNVSSRANTVNGKLTAGMLEMHRQRSTAPAKIVSLANEKKGFFDMSQTGPSEVMPSQQLG